MLQLWKLILLCGLLVRTSESQALDLQETYVNEGLEQKINEVDNVKSEVQGEIDSIGQTLKNELQKLQDSTIWQKLTNTVQESKGILGNIISSIGSLGAELTAVRILDVNLKVNPETNTVNMRFPISAQVKVALPMLGQLVNLNVSLDLLTTATIDEIESENPTLILGECKTDPASFKVVLFNGKSPGINKLVDTVVSLKQKVVSFLIEKAICPLLHTLIDSQLGVIIKNILSKCGQNPKKNKLQLEPMWESEDGAQGQVR